MQAAQTVLKAAVSQDELSLPWLVKEKETPPFKQILLCNSTSPCSVNAAKSFHMEKPGLH